MVDGEFQKSNEPFESAAKLFQKIDTDGVPPSEFIKSLAKGLRCCWGTYWKFDSGTNRLRPVTTWSSLDKNLGKDVKILSLRKETADQVRKTRRPFWTNNLLNKMSIGSLSLDGGIWFAVKIGDKVFGVVELLGSGLPAGDEEILLLVEQMGIKLGYIIKLISKKT